MSTKEKLENDLKAAIKSNDDLRKRTLRMALSSIRLSEIDQGKPLEEDALKCKGEGMVGLCERGVAGIGRSTFFCMNRIEILRWSGERHATYSSCRRHGSRESGH